MMKNKKYIPYLVLILLLYGFLIFANRTFDPYKIRIINLCFVYVVLAISLNIINGFAGLFSLGHAGFMALGAYTSAILTMSPAGKAATYYMIPITPILANVQLSFPLALLVAGAVTAFFGFLIGFPVFFITGHIAEKAMAERPQGAVAVPFVIILDLLPA